MRRGPEPTLGCININGRPTQWADTPKLWGTSSVAPQTTPSGARWLPASTEPSNEPASVQRKPRSALRRCSEELFDLVLLDITFPDADGRDVCCELRGRERAQKARIIALTGHSDLKGSAFMSDFDECIVKPITMQALEDQFCLATRSDDRTRESSSAPNAWL